MDATFPVDPSARRLSVAFSVLLVAFAAACSAPESALPTCERTQATQALLQRVDANRWLGWIRKLSGDEPVTVGGDVVTILTRNSLAMASGAPDARAFEWLVEQVQERFPADAVDVQEFRENWRNLTVTRPGTDLGDETILAIAHLDSLVMEGQSGDRAPGADDDGTGVAALLELATVLPDATLRRTVRLVFVSGEEQGLVGCGEWVAANDLSGVRAVVNLDMLGWDGAGDRTLQVHVDGQPDSTRLLECVDTVNRDFELGLTLDPRAGALAMGNSCHSAFWNEGVPAAWISENMVESGLVNPYAHTVGDTVESLSLPYAFDMARVAVATVLSLAEPREVSE